MEELEIGTDFYGLYYRLGKLSQCLLDTSIKIPEEHREDIKYLIRELTTAMMTDVGELHKLNSLFFMYAYDYKDNHLDITLDDLFHI